MPIPLKIVELLSVLSDITDMAGLAYLEPPLKFYVSSFDEMGFSGVLANKLLRLGFIFLLRRRGL